jgi:nucleoredoxin
MTLKFCRTKMLLWLGLGLLPVAALRAELPSEVTITVPTQLEVMRGERVSGSISLEPGTRVELIDVTDDYLLVHYRNTNGRVLAAHTDLPPGLLKEAAAQPIERSKTGRKPRAALPPVPVPPQRAQPPVTAMERAFYGRLVHLEDGVARPFDCTGLPAVKFYAIYFSANWCEPCRAVTPGLVEAYPRLRELYPEFELVLVNRDQSAQEMEAYMKDAGIQFPALNWDATKLAAEINGYAGPGIPCLVLVDETGKVLSDTYRKGVYVGPNQVLEEMWQILRDYRRRNPRRQE